MSRNAVVTVSLFAFLWSWSDFVFAGTLVNGGAHEPITLGIYHYIGNLVVAQRYVAAGFAEDFDALTGTGLRDHAYTWTAASYLLLAETHAHRSSNRLQ